MEILDIRMSLPAGPALAIYIGTQESAMAQTDNPFLDGMARIFTDAAGAAKSVRDEIDTFVKQRLERLVADMDFVPREEFEAVKAMAAKARAENERLEARIAALESKAPPPGS
jgi:BMFP domain-containing protein YqiC